MDVSSEERGMDVSGEERGMDISGGESGMNVSSGENGMDVSSGEDRMEDRTGVYLEAELSPFLNYGLQQNGYPVIRSLSVMNASDQAVRDLTVEVKTDGGFFHDCRAGVAEVPAGSSVQIRSLKPAADAGRLAELTERVTETVTLTLSADGEELDRVVKEMVFYAYDEWCGFEADPAYLASFVTPNHPKISAVIARASQFMREWTGDSSFDAYQTQDPNRVLKQAAALYEAIRELRIVYAEPPASFEKSGQRIRMADSLVSEKMGTCMDLSLFYASCLEAAGLNPILILENHHIYPGVWLEKKTFRDALEDDPSLIGKHMAEGIGELTVVESTLLTEGRDVPFDAARARSAEKAAKIENIQYIIDVRRARMAGILPLPLRIRTEEGWSVAETKETAGTAGAAVPAAPKELSGRADAMDSGAGASGAEEKNQRIRAWERRLLDLGLRNALINFRLSGTMIPFFTASLNELEDALSDGREFTVEPKPAEWKLREGEELSFESLLEAGAAEELIRSEYKNRRLHTAMTETALKAAVKQLYRSAKTTLEENGANSLYLALGVLRWYETEKSQKPRYAPIVLMPVELVRKAANMGYRLRMRDEESVMNVTLLEMLKQSFGIDIGGLDPLPADEHGTDLTKVFTLVRRAVMNERRWDVLETASLGIFSFSQFVMWNDIRNRMEDLSRNRVVKSLMDGKLCWDAVPMDQTASVSEEDVLLPMTADASQLYALKAAAAGESFVLHGPPGTGKSQTITNLIGNALSQGKTVLFVAEKMAALSVVEERLKKIGIGPFCLELHSNKSNKRDVLSQLQEAAEVSRGDSGESYERDAAQASRLRHELDSYAESLHRVRRSGLSLWDMVNLFEAEKMGERENAPAFSEAFAEKETSALLQDQEILLSRMTAAGRAVGHPHGHPLGAVKAVPYSQKLKAAVPSRGEAYLKTLGSFENTLNTALPDISRNRTRLDELKEKLSHVLEAGHLKEELLRDCTEEVLTQDTAALRSEWETIQGKWFLPQFFGKRSFLSKISSFTKTKATPESFPAVLDLLDRFREEEALGGEFAGSSPAQALHGGVSAEELYQALQETDSARAAFTEVLPLANPSAGQDWIAAERENVSAAVSHTDQLRDWILYASVEEEAAAAGLTPVIRAYRKGLSHEEVVPAFRCGAIRALIGKAIEEEEPLNRFSGAVFNEQISELKRITDELEQYTRKEIYARLAARVPSFSNEASAKSELGILKRAIKSGGRGKSIRSLFREIPNLLPRLCPCMLMSPLSAAQYLDPKREMFDIVVFDEASQLTTSKAVGALARGKSAVVVGDPKQMPPTSFFVSSREEEEDPENEDLESILDDCLALGMPETHLLWHYRSRHESLIAFSNAEFYENRLYTFPSVNDRERKVSFVKVDGRFERGGQRRNTAEAEAVVQEVVRRAKDPALRGMSVGIVTFNISQQNLIDDLLETARGTDGELDAWCREAEEPLFIKNLENVQGDERDVILFSVGFGPDADGKMTMNFGPINRTGGWRRLNVAVSRSRMEMKVFTSMDPEQIDLGRSSAEGVRALKDFLFFARDGRLDVKEELLQQESRGSVSGIAAEICERLEALGYETAEQVGHSRFRLDIGVIHPEKQETYLAGILLDGPSYRDARSTRERELSQKSVLQGLGWKLYRIWTMDWWDNKEREMERLAAWLTEIREEERREAEEAARAAEEAAKEAARAAEEAAKAAEEAAGEAARAEEEAAGAVGEAAKAAKAAEYGTSGSAEEGKAEDTAGETAGEIGDDKNIMAIEEPLGTGKEAPVTRSAAAPIRTARVVRKQASEEERSGTGRDDSGENSAGKPYRIAELPVTPALPEELLTPSGIRKAGKRIALILEAEGPVSERLLTRRLLSSFRISRAGSRIQSLVSDSLRQMKAAATLQDETVFYWAPGQNPETYREYRYGSDEDTKREPQDLPVQEMAAACLEVLVEQIALPKEDLMREAAKKLGYPRLGVNLSRVMEQGVRYAEEKYGIHKDNRGNYVPGPAS